MKKRFVAKQVGVLSLTAVLAGMPAVNVLAEDVYAQKVESLQKEMLEQAVATETKLNITFETVHGEKVGETVAKTTATGTGDWTFMLGTDYQLPAGYQLATGVEQVTNVAVPFGATAGHTVVVEPVAGAVTETKLNITFETVHGEKVGETVAKTTATGTGDWTFMLGTDYQLPEGYQLATGVEQVTNIQVPFGATAGHTMIVEKNTETPDKPDPENPEKPDPENPEKPDPENPEKPNPENPEKPDPENPEKPNPENPEKPNPENPEKPNPENPEKPNPENPEKPNQDNTNKDDGKTQEKDKKTENKSKTPKTGDDLQAAGTFSILGAGALVAIVALLKKRK